MVCNFNFKLIGKGAAADDQTKKKKKETKRTRGVVRTKLKFPKRT